MQRIPAIVWVLPGLITMLTAEAGVYLGAGLGKSDYNDSLWSVEDGANDTGWKLFGGYQFNPYICLEAAWVDLGKVKYRNASIETRGLAIDGIGAIPVGPIVSIFGKLGMFVWDQDIRVDTERDDNTGNDLTWGYGMGVRLFDNRLGIRIEWERYKSDNDADFISLSTSYHF